MTRAQLLSPLLALLLAVSGISFAQREPAQEVPAAAADLPVTRVVLFTSGIGYFEHSGTVADDAEMELSVSTGDMDDLLQSLVLQDFDGGTIRPVRYDSRDPLARVLSSYSLDLSGNPNLAGLLSQARGERVRLETSQELVGTVVNVERVSVPEAEARTYLTLATSTGLRQIDLAEVRQLSFESAELQEELEAALAAIARFRGEEENGVRLRFEGEGERRVSIGYVREMPVWKTSYRLLVGEDDRAYLQGWAIFDNPTDTDLEGISVSFVAGRPVSFVTELFEPMYVPRPRVSSQAAAPVAPRAFAADAFMQEAAESERAALMAPPAAAPRFDSDAGVESLAEGSQQGASFEYRVSEPVTIGRHESAMIPIISSDVGSELLSVYDPAVHQLHPLRGLRLVNDTGLHLAAGPVSVFDSGGFAGNALIEDIVPGDSRVLAYALDLDLQIAASSEVEPEQVVALAIRNGSVETRVSERIATTYEIDSRTDAPRLLVIEHPRRAGYEVVSPETPPATTAGTYRFGVAIEGSSAAEVQEDSTVPTHMRCGQDESCELTIVLERTLSRTFAIGNLSDEQILYYLENVELSAEDREVLRQVVELRDQIVSLDRELASVRADIEEIHVDQGRIRQNMAGLERNSTLYRRYVSELEEQENELALLADRSDDLATQRRELQERLDELLRSLSS